MDPAESRFDFDYLVVGAGPAGLQLGYYLQRSGRDYLLLEGADRPGAFFTRFPRHRKLISINKVFTGCDDPETNLRWDWNSLLTDDHSHLFSSVTRRYFPEADDILRYLGDFAERFGIRVRYDTPIVRVSRREDGAEGFALTDGQGNVFTCRRLIVAAGLTKPYIPPIPGIEHGESYFDFPVDPHDFENQRVLIVGKGNSAFETAENLTETTAVIQLCSPTPVTLAWKTHYVGNLRAINNNFLDTYQLKSQNGILDAYIERIERQGDGFAVHILYTHAKSERREIPFDRILICTGFRFDDSVFDETCRPALTCNGKFPAQTAEWESVDVPGLYFAGNLMHSRDYKRTMSGFIHGFRYNVRALAQILERKHEETELPSREVAAEPRQLTAHVIDRINRSSAMFLQPAFFCDAIVAEDGVFRFYEDVPTDYAREGDIGQSPWWYTLSLEYGDFHTPPDPFNVERDPDPAQAHTTAYLHPILRRYQGDRLVAEHHIPEDLENVYSAAKYEGLIQDLFRSELAARRGGPGAPGEPHAPMSGARASNG